LKWARPKWNRNVKLVQQTLIVSITIYFVFICEPGYETPFDGFRVWFFDKLGGLGVLSGETKMEVERLRVEGERVREEGRLKKMEEVEKGTSPVISEASG
jgi:hypothetical protein